MSSDSIVGLVFIVFGLAFSIYFGIIWIGTSFDIDDERTDEYKESDKK
jgi:hypothetical protein